MPRRIEMPHDLPDEIYSLFSSFGNWWGSVVHNDPGMTGEMWEHFKNKYNKIFDKEGQEQTE